MPTTAKKINPRAVERALVRYTCEAGSHDPYRYRGRLGMSRINQPEDELVAAFLGEPAHADTDRLLLFDTGDLFEADVHEKLEQIYNAEHCYYQRGPVEIVAGFDARFAGHGDGEIVTPDEAVLVEVKSTTADKLERIKEHRRVPRSCFQQVQLYMRHGRYRRCLVVFVARDSGAFYVHELRPIEAVADELDEKARRVLAEVDRRRALAAA